MRPNRIDPHRDCEGDLDTARREEHAVRSYRPAGASHVAVQLTTGNMVLLGAAGGAGYAKRPNAYERPRWEIKVRMDAGGVRTVTHDYEPALREGDRVRVYGTQLELVST